MTSNNVKIGNNDYCDTKNYGSNNSNNNVSNTNKSTFEWKRTQFNKKCKRNSIASLHNSQYTLVANL